uniref:separase n=1 Tax=Oryza brachyantha TaxID=4533 RepID=J3LHH6_ORYBR
MEPAAADLLAALSSPSSHASLRSRFAAYLEPFSPYLPTLNPSAKPPPKRTTKQGMQQQPPPPTPDAATVRPLAKRFLPFLCRALQVLPPLLRPNPSSRDAGCPDELLDVYGLLLDCLAVISTCLAGKPYSVLLQRGRFVCCLESRGHYARAEADAAATLDSLRSVLSVSTASKSRRAASVASLLPDPGVAREAGADPEVTILAVELTVCFANCASKCKVKDAAPYERVVNLVENLQPWLRILAEDVSRKYLTLLVNALSRCAIFLAAESSLFDTNLVREFCRATLGECMKAQTIERLPAVARRICSSVDVRCVGSTQLLLDVLNTVVGSSACVKADLPRSVNEIVEFVSSTSATASVLILYAIGLYFSAQQIENGEQPHKSTDFLNNEKYLQTLNSALATLEHLFCFANGRSTPLDTLGKASSSTTHPGHSNKHTLSHSDDHISSVAYLDSLEFLCKILSQYVNAVWKNFSDGTTPRYSRNMTYVLTALHQFIDSSISAYSCTKMPEGDKERLNEQHGTLLKALVSATKVSFVTKEGIQKSMSFINFAISSTWINLDELKYLMSSLGNIGVTLYNIGHLDEAPKAIELCCQTIWVHTRLSYHRLSASQEGQIIVEDIPKDTMKDIITDAFARIAKMVDTLHKCGVKMISDVIVKSLSELLADDGTIELLNSSLVLIKLWVKITRKDVEDDESVDSAPLLYHPLIGYSPPLPKKLVGLILEQELLAYALVESRGTMLCVKMQKRIIDILLNKLYCSTEHYLERSRVLVKKARVLRASGVQSISSCLESLSEAISLLEANLGAEVIFDNAQNVRDLLSKVRTFCYYSPGMISHQPSETLVPLLCSLVDLLAMKGCSELQFDLCNLMINIWKQENLPVEKLFSMLRLWPIDSFISTSPEPYFRRLFGFSGSVHEVDSAASSLVSEVSSNDQSIFLAGYMYFDLSDRLLSRGQIFQAFSYGKEALQLRKKLLRKKFKFNVGKFATEGSQCSGGQSSVSLEAWGSTIAEIWPDHTRSTGTGDYFLTPWNVLRCYLESILQVALLHDMVGNGAEAEVLLRTGKDISHFHGLAVFGITFTSALGQIYHKRQQWDSAESELKCARDLLAQNAAFVSCKLCKLTLDISVDVQTGDLFWSLFEKDFQKQSPGNLPNALGMYQSAMDKLKSTKLELPVGSYDKHKTTCIACSKAFISETKHEVCNNGKELLAANDGVLPSCNVCANFSQTSGDQPNKFLALKSQKHILKDYEGCPPLDVKVKRTTRNSSRLAKEQNVEAHVKNRTRSSKRTAHVKGEKASAELSKNDISCSDEMPTNALDHGKTNCSLDGVDKSMFYTCDAFGCWNCLFVNSLNSGSIQNILQLRWDWVWHQNNVSILLKIARALGAHGGLHGAHEVHNIYWQCISSLYFRSLPQDCYRTYELNLIGLVMDENTGDFLTSERAEILYSMSLFLLKGFLSEQSRDMCCRFCSVQMPDVVPWLLRAFVLSRENPLLFQEVCRLLACIFLLATIDSTAQLPLYSNGSLSLSHWAAYFHQSSVGTYLNCHYFASLQSLPRKKNSKGPVEEFRYESDEGISKFLRFSSTDIGHLEIHIIEFFDKLPDVPIVCISMLEGDFVNVLGEILLLPSFFPAWMLLSRFDSTNKPITMLLPVDAISEETQHEDSYSKELGNPVRSSDKNWQCPWGYTIIDYVAPTFKKILEENFISLSSATLTLSDGQANHVRWWSYRMKLNNHLDKILKNMEESWLGPWKCLLLGYHSTDQHIEAALANLIAALESEFKFEVNPVLIKVILGGATSVDEVHDCVSQLIMYKGYFGRGGCCGKDRLRAFSSCGIESEALETVECLITSTVNELTEPVDRDPVIFVLDTNVQMLPWENLPGLRSQEIYRMPSVGGVLLALTRSNDYCKDARIIAPQFPAIDPFNTFYLLNPSGDLSSTQEEFDQLFKTYEWKGKAGYAPTAEELVLALKNHDLFLYFGHGSGTQYVSGKEIEKLDDCAAALLMGCSSGTLHCKGGYAPQGAPLSYLFAGSPAVIANLWDVSDKDIDRFSKALLDSWLQENLMAAKNCSKCCRLTQEFESMTIAAEDNGRPRRRGARGKKPEQVNDSSKRCTCGDRRVASHLSEARRACRLPLMIGASPVCYGVPTIIRKK